MIDMAAFAIPFKDEHLLKANSAAPLVDMRELSQRLGIPMQASFTYNQDGTTDIHRLRHNFDSLPSHYASLSYQIVNSTDLRNEPYVKVQGNPAKLLTGHNVFGSDDIELTLLSVAEAFFLAFPELANMLNWMHATVSYIDVTYSARCKNDHEAQQLINVLKNVNYGQMKVSECQYESTVYWNKTSKMIQRKAYLKGPEQEKRVAELTRKLANERLAHYAYQLEAITSEEVRNMAVGAIRFEARLFASWLKDKGIPCSFALMTSKANCNLYDNQFTGPIKPVNPQELWRLAFQPVFKAFEGAKMTAYDDTKVLNELHKAFDRITSKGNLSTSKADRLYKVYRQIRNDGFERARLTTDRATFMRQLNDLQVIGLSRAQLQAFTSSQSNVVPLIQLINVDFATQLPASWKEPKPLRNVSPRSLQAQPRPALKLAS